MSLDQDSYDPIPLSRSLMGGKKTARPKFATTDEHDMAMQVRANELGISKSELIERFTIVGMYGVEHAKSLHDQQFARVSKAWTSVGPSVAPAHGASTGEEA